MAAGFPEWRTEQQKKGCFMAPACSDPACNPNSSLSAVYAYGQQKQMHHPMVSAGCCFVCQVLAAL